MSQYIRSKTSILVIALLALATLKAVFGSEVLGQVTNSNSSKNNTSTSSATIARTTNQANVSNTLSSITGSIPLGSTISSAISSKVKISLNEAVTTAQKSIGANSFVTSAFIRPLNGYLVYDIHVRDNSNNTPYAVVVDPGNGKVLYKQALQSSSFGTRHFGSMFEKDKAGSFFGARGEGCDDHSHHWFSSGFVKNGGDDNNFAGRYMHIDTDKNNFNSLNNIEDTRD